MSQVGTLFLERAVVQFELPDANDEVLPGLRWGALEAFPTPAYWTYQVLARRVLAGPPTHRLGKTLAEEVVACLLGGYGIPASVGLAAFEQLKSQGLLDNTPTASAVRASLHQPLIVRGRTVHYRFASRKAVFVAAALRVLATDTPPQEDGRRLRDWLLQIEGIGYKTASWIARNWLDADDVAILDVHLKRAGALGGFLNGALRSANYLELEEQFLRFSHALGVRPSELDAVIWHEMMSSPKTVKRLLNDRPPSSSNICTWTRLSDERNADAVQSRCIE